MGNRQASFRNYFAISVCYTAYAAYREKLIPICSIQVEDFFEKIRGWGIKAGCGRAVIAK